MIVCIWSKCYNLPNYSLSEAVGPLTIMIKKVLVTGATGFIGKNLIDLLSKSTSYEILQANSITPVVELINKVKEADFIVHLAGVTRTEDNNQFYTGNSKLTERIISTLIEDNKKVPIVFASSIHATADNDYGKSKRAAEESILDYQKKQKVPVYIIRLTNTFGRWAKPNYHSVVATFCYNLAHDLDIYISDPQKKLNLLYIDDVIHCILDIIKGEQNSALVKVKDGEFYRIDKTYPKTLASLVESITFFKKNKNLKPKNEFEERLYSTYKSYEEKL
ncbi:MAG: capsular biosynthesis protein [Segetibacter sp.]|nr:capsular biosynthesis protein [Segetibacter sp.]